jgi:hypothetical protein
MTDYRFIPGSLKVVDAQGQSLACVHSREERTRNQTTGFALEYRVTVAPSTS